MFLSPSLYYCFFVFLQHLTLLLSLSTSPLHPLIYYFKLFMIADAFITFFSPGWSNLFPTTLPRCAFPFPFFGSEWSFVCSMFKICLIRMLPSLATLFEIVDYLSHFTVNHFTYCNCILLLLSVFCYKPKITN